MSKLRLVTAMLLALPLSTFVAACGGQEDSDARAALEREALERELDLALQPDTTVQPELQDVAEEPVEEAPLPPRPAPSLEPEPEPRRPTPVRRAPPRPVQPRRVERVPDPAPAPAPAPARPRVVTLSAPAGTRFSVNLDQELSTRRSGAGESFTATLSEPIVSDDGTTLIPAGATVHGRVTESRKSGRAGEEAVLRITFTSISHGGRSYAIDASATEVPSRLVTRDGTGTKAAKIGGGAAVGAIVGRVIGKSTKATIAGAAVGAAAGTAVAMGTADVDRVISAGSRVDVRLDAPVRVTREVGDG